MKRLMVLSLAILCLVPGAMASVGPVGVEHVTLTASLGLAEAHCTVRDALFLNDGRMLIVGDRRPEQSVDGFTDAYAVIIDPRTGEKIWEHVVAPNGRSSSSLAFSAAVLREDSGFSLCMTEGSTTILQHFDADGAHLGDSTHDGIARAMVSAPSGDLLIAGSKGPGAWFVRTQQDGTELFERMGPWNEDDSPAYFAAAAVMGDGVLLAGTNPAEGCGPLAQRYDWDGQLIIEGRYDNVGQMTGIDAVCVNDNRVLLIGPASRETGADSASVASTVDDGVLGVLNDPTVGHNYQNGEQLPNRILGVQGQAERGYILGGWCEDETSPAEKTSLLYTADILMNIRDAYGFDYGSSSEAVRVLQDADGVYWVVGHGNGEGLMFSGEASAVAGQRVYVGCIDEAFTDTTGVLID